MKRTAYTVSLALMLLSMVSVAKYKLYPDERPVEFLQSLVLGPKNVTIYIPRAYHMVQHEQKAHQHKMGFVYDRESLEKWNQFVSLNIITNTTETASMRINMLQGYLNKNYKDIRILDSNIHRHTNGLQDAYVSASYQDESGEMILAARYYSDSASLIGVEVSQKVRSSLGNALRSAEKVTESVIQLSNT